MTNLDDAILKRTPQNTVDKIYELFSCIDQCLRQHGVAYSIFGGSLLGAVRHNGLIPWDDDGDIVVHVRDREKMIAALQVAAQQAKFGFCKEDISYKFYPTDGKKIWASDVGRWAMNVARFPFIDIFILEPSTDGLLRYSEDLANELFPNEFLHLDEWETNTEYEFGPLKLRGINRISANRYLTDSYGEGWDNSAYLTWNHVEWKWNEKQVVQLVDKTPALPSLKSVNRIEILRAKLMQDPC